MNLIENLLIFIYNVVVNQTNVAKEIKLSNKIMIYDDNQNTKILSNLINEFLIL